MLKIVKKSTISGKACKLLALLLHWNILVGICDQIALLTGIAGFSLIAKYSVVFSVLFFACTFFLVLLDGRLQRGVLFLLAWFPLLFLSYIINPEVKMVFPRATIYYVNNIFCIAALFSYVSDAEKLISLLKKYIVPSVFYSLLFLASNLWVANDGTYDMAFSYATMIPAVLSLMIALRGRGKERLYFVPFFIIFIVNLKCGSRGSLLCYFLALFINFCFCNLESKKRQVVLVVFVILFLVIGWDELIHFLSVMFPESRNVRLLATGQALYPANRQHYYISVLEEFIKQPLKVRGLYADRFFLLLGEKTLDNVWGSYSHNIILEIIFQFGALGIVIVMAFICYVGKMFSLTIRSKNREIIVLTTVFVTCGMGQLFFSSSYLVSPFFGALWGLMLFLLKTNNAELAN